MTEETLKKANKLQTEIDRVKRILYSNTFRIEYTTNSIYCSETSTNYYMPSGDIQNKIKDLLKQKLEQLKKELEEE